MHFTKIIHCKISIAVFVLYFFSYVSAVDETLMYNPSLNNCGHSYIKDNGELAYIGKKDAVPENVFCTWNITASKSFNEIFLELDSFVLFENDSFVIRNSSDNKVIFGPYSGFQGRFMIATGAIDLVAELKTSPVKYPSDRSFLVKFSRKECKMDLSNVQSGSVSSPVYNNNRTEAFNCQYTMNGFGVNNKMYNLALTLTNFTFKHSVLRITSQKETYKNPTNLPNKLFTKGKVIFDIQINASSQNEYFKMQYQIVHDACSGSIALNHTQPTQTISFLSPPNPQNSPISKDSVHCEWLITSPIGTKIRSNFPVLDLKSSEDQLVISSSVTEFHPVWISSHNHHLFKDKPIVSPSNEFMMNFDTSQNIAGPQFMAEFSILKESDLNVETGKVMIKDLADYNFKVNADKIVKVQFDDKISQGTVLDLYPDLIYGKPRFLTVDHNYPLQWVTSPTNELKMVVRKKNEHLNVRFSGVNMDCDLTLVEDEGSIDLSKTCHDKCLLILPNRISNDIFKIKIESAQAQISISSLTQKVYSFLEFDNGNFAKVDVPTREGALITVTRNCHSSEKEIVKITYEIEESCEINYKLSVGQSVAVSSPNFPDIYPFNSKCHWKIESISNQPTSYFVTFNKFSLGDYDSLRINGNDMEFFKRVSETAPMPKDYIFKSPMEITFESHTQRVFEKVHNFLFHITALECVVLKNTSEGLLSFTQSNITFDLCIGFILVPLQTQFQYTSIYVKVNKAEKTGLKIYDGVSVRSPILRVANDGTGMSSSNQILIIYKRTGAIDSQTPVQIEYRAFGCNESNFCKTGACMKPEWKCNGINECGDYSDEIGCLVTHPTNPSTLTMKSTQESSTKDALTEILTNESPTTISSAETTYELPQNQAVEAMELKISMNTMIFAIAGVVVGFSALLITIYVFQRRHLKKRFQNPNRWEALSTSNPSYQSDKDIEHQPPLPVAHISVTQESARHHDNRNREI